MGEIGNWRLVIGDWARGVLRTSYCVLRGAWRWDEKTGFIRNRRDKSAHLAARRKSDWQSDLHLAVHHGNSQRAKNCNGKW